MRHFKIISASLTLSLALVACHQPTKVNPSRNDEESPQPVDQSSNAALAGLSLSAGALTPAFSEGISTYTIDVAYPTETTTVTAIVADAKASVSLNGAAPSAKAASAILPLPVGRTELAVVVTAEDGSTSRTYTVTVNRPGPSADATLSALAFSAGTLAFDAATTAYAFDVTAAVTSTTVTATTTQTTASLTIHGSAETSGQASKAIALAYGANVIAVVVTAEDGSTSRTYTVTVNRLRPPADAMLSALAFSAGTLAFDAATTTYAFDVTAAVTSTTVTATTAQTTASLTIHGSAETSGQASKAIALAYGANVIAVVVTAEDGSTSRTYTVTVNRLPPSADATLSALAFSAGTLAFDAATTAYAFDVTAAVTSTTVTATTAQTTARLTIHGSAETSGQASKAIALAYGANVIDVVVTAQDGSTQKTYQVTITKLADAAEAMLSALVPSDGTLDPVFSPFNDVYNLDVPNDVGAIAFTPTANHKDATITLGGRKVDSGQLSAAVSLDAPGTYDLAFVVTAQDGRTTHTYTVHVRRLSSTDLGNLAVTPHTLAPAFNAGILSYTAHVDSSTAEIIVHVTVVDPTSSLQIADKNATSGTPEHVPLQFGENTIAVVVTGNGGSPTKTYNLTVTRGLSSDAHLAAVEVNGIAIDPSPVSNSNYRAEVSNDTVAVSLTVTPADTNANVVVSVYGDPKQPSAGSYAITLTGQNTTIAVIITAQDGSSILYYYVTVARTP